MDLERVRDELSRLPPRAFTAVRDERVSEARKAGTPEIAAALKKLHKPTVGAWLSNLLAHEHAEDLEHLIGLGEHLRKGRHGADGQLIRRVSKEKQDAIAGLLQKAKSTAALQGQPVSGAATMDLEATLDAAFADSNAAQSVRAGRLTTALHYSGLGFATQGPEPSARRAIGRRPGGTATRAKRELEVATREAAQADAALEKARAALEVAEDDLKRRRADVTLAGRRARDAHKKASAAEKNMGN